MYDIVIMLLSHPSIHPSIHIHLGVERASCIRLLSSPACMHPHRVVVHARKTDHAGFLPICSAHCPTNHTKHTQQNKKKLRYILCNHENADTHKSTMSLIVVDISGFLKNRAWVGRDINGQVPPYLT